MNRDDFRAVFIGGVGRSGTTPLAEALGKHPDIYAFPKELRFITDPDGLISLKNALVDNWSFFHADFAVERFKKLMQNLSTKYVGRYPTNSLRDYVEKGYYSRWVDDYVNSLVGLRFKSAWVGRATLLRKLALKYLGRNSLTEKILEDSYYCAPLSEGDFFSKTGVFVMDYFSHAAGVMGKEIAVEHTPLNLIHADFLCKLLPGMKLIHIYRDPKDIASSFGTRDWGSGDTKFNFKWIAETYGRWELVKRKIPQNCYYEVAFEKFISNFEAELKKICDFLNIKFAPTMLGADISRHNIGRWKKGLTESDVSYLNGHYADLLKRYGYV